MSPPSDPAHGDVVMETGRQLMNFGARVFTETHFHVSKDIVYLPDLCVYRPGRIKGRIGRLPPAPD